MNKLLYVNIGGLVFQIDENAYQKLDNYLNSIRRKYNTIPDGEEIIKDIEQRIAELFIEKVGERGAITDQYVDEVIVVMGKPEDYDSGIHQDEPTHAHHEKKSGGSKFYRDKETSMLGGVCSGFAAKFDIDVLWMRLAFLISFLFFGTGLLLYIILWILIPEAKTTAERLEMRGEKVDINNIEKTIKEGAKQFTTKVNEFGEEVKQTFSRENMNKSKKNAGDFIESAAMTVKPVVQGITRVFAFALLVVCLLIVVVISIELFTNWGNQFSDIDFLGNNIMRGSQEAWLLVTCAIALLIIPLIGIIFSSVKYLVGIKKKTKYVSLFLGFLWTVSLFTVIYLGITTGRQFREEIQVTEKIEIAQPTNNTMYIMMDKPDKYPLENNVFDAQSKHGHSIFKKDFWYEDENYGFFTISKDSFAFNHITVEIEQSLDSNFVVLINKSARGSNKPEAKQNAQETAYTILQPADSLLNIPSIVSIQSNEKWHNQQVKVIIRVPINKQVFVNSNLEYYLNENEYTSGLKHEELYGGQLKMTLVGLKPMY